MGLLQNKIIDIHPNNVSDEFSQQHGSCNNPPSPAEKSCCNGNHIANKRYKGKKDKPISKTLKFI